MTMTQREKYLAMGVGAVVGLFGLQYITNSLNAKLQAKQILVDTARQKNDEMTRTVTSGQMAANKISQLNTKSLPTKKETLVAQYHDWLTRLAEEVGMTEIGVNTPDRPVKETNAYAAYQFKLTGEIRTNQWIDLLARYYDADYLHNITGLKANLNPRIPGQLTLTLDSQALALRGAGQDQVLSHNPSGRLQRSIDEYRSAILNRNPFAPPNQPPQYDGEKSFEATLGQRFSQILKGKDAEQHDVRFELVSSSWDGLKLEGTSLIGTPEETGQYEVIVRAVDDGWPSRASEHKLVVKVVEPKVEPPPVEKPKFDVASQAFITALLNGGSGPTVWIRSRTEGTTLKLPEGADFEVGSIKAKVVSIHDDFVELESDGKHWTFGMDSSLADAYASSSVD